jgi:hypothetical protein
MWHGKRVEKYYHVEWSAPIIRNSGHISVMALNKTEAIAKAKRKLGAKVKSQHLHHFSAF